MAVRTLATGDLDTEVAMKIHDVLTGGPLTLFREQLLDVIRTNVADLYTYDEGDDDA